jgi:membrane protease YdiL (CAAX protease family)
MPASLLFKDDRLRPWLRVIIYIVAAVLAQAGIGLFVGAIYLKIYGPRAMFMRTPVLLDEFIAAIAVVGASIVLRIFLDRRSVASLGLGFGPPTPDSTRSQQYMGALRLFIVGFAFGAGMQLFVFAILLAFHQTNLFEVRFNAAVGYQMLAWAAIFFIAALSEEYPLRGYILQNLWEEWGFWPAAIVTSILFALLHVKNPYFGDLPWLTILNIAVDGIWACCAVLWTRSLWLPWAAHFAWNLFEGPVLGRAVSGINTGASIVVQNPIGDPLLTGGRFGPEAGIVVLIAEIAGILVLYLLYRRGVFERAPDTREQYAIASA